MSGHSHSHNVKGTKSIQDAKRSNLFAKFSRDIYISAKLGGGDIKNNPLLRDIVKRAKEVSMPQERIQNAIDKGTGKINEGFKFVEKTYEVYGVGGEATFLIECLTDNPNRTLSQIKEIVYRLDAKLVPEGSISWDYSEVVSINLSLISIASKDQIILNLFEIEGIKDVLDLSEEKQLLVIIDKEKSREVIDKIREDNGVEILNIEVAKLANHLITLSEELIDKNNLLEEAIYNINEVEGIWKNYK